MSGRRGFLTGAAVLVAPIGAGSVQLPAAGTLHATDAALLRLRDQLDELTERQRQAFERADREDIPTKTIWLPKP